MRRAIAQQIRDLGGAAAASVAATALDGICFALLQWQGTFDGLPVHTTGVHAFMAAIIGGIAHYAMCRFWVFERFENSTAKSLALYAAMSLSAALLHSGFTASLAYVLPSQVSWIFSKIGLYLLWTYPLSRYVVFGDTTHTQGHA